jgi:hypothetical protein
VCQKWSARYGWPVFQIRLGNMRAVVVNTFDTCKEMLLDHSNQVIDRPTLYTFHGLISSTQGPLPSPPVSAPQSDLRVYNWEFSVRRKLQETTQSSRNSARETSHEELLTHVRLGDILCDTRLPKEDHVN